MIKLNRKGKGGNKQLPVVVLPKKLLRQVCWVMQQGFGLWEKAPGYLHDRASPRQVQNKPAAAQSWATLCWWHLCENIFKKG